MNFNVMQVIAISLGIAATVAFVSLHIATKRRVAQSTSKMNQLTAGDWHDKQALILAAVFDLTHREMDRPTSPRQVMHHVASEGVPNPLDQYDVNHILRNLACRDFVRYGVTREGSSNYGQIYLTDAGYREISDSLKEPVTTSPAVIQVNGNIGSQILVARDLFASSQTQNTQSEQALTTAIMAFLKKLETGLRSGDVSVADYTAAAEASKGLHEAATATATEETPARIRNAIRAMQLIITSAATTALTTELTSDIERLLSMAHGNS